MNNRFYFIIMKKPAGIEQILPIGILVRSWGTDDHTDACRVSLDLLNGSITAGNKIFKLQEIAGRISANAQFRKNCQICAALFCEMNSLNDPFSIVFKIANMIILLNQRDLHETNLLLRPGILSCSLQRFYPDEKKNSSPFFTLYNCLQNR